MTTKTTRPDSPRAAALRRMLAGPLEVRIDGAQAYWLGGLRGAPLGPESDRTLAPCAEALTMIGAGTDPETLVVWARLADGRPYRVSCGIYLVDMAEAASGIPARPRILRE